MEDIVFEVEHLDSTIGSGVNGWSPALAVAADGERRVLEVIDWFGGGGTKPAIGQYLGSEGLVDDIADAIDIRGAAGSGSGSGDAATLNGQAPTYYLSRTNHTGTQAPATIAQDVNNRFVTDAEKSTWNAKQNALGFTPAATTDPRLSDARTPTAHTHAIAEVTDLTDQLAGKESSSNKATDLTSPDDTKFPTTLAVSTALSGKANTSHTHSISQVTNLQAELDDKADDAATTSALNAKANTVDLATVATSGSYADLSSRPVYAVESEVPADFSVYPDGSLIAVVP